MLENRLYSASHVEDNQAHCGHCLQLRLKVSEIPNIRSALQLYSSILYQASKTTVLLLLQDALAS
jgi:hypothetical protein